MEKVMNYGVMSMPAIVVNEQVVSMGKVLKASQVEELLKMLGCQQKDGRRNGKEKGSFYLCA